MTTQTLDTLTRRLDRLEREIRWWRKIGGVGALAVMVLAGLLGASGGCNPHELRAERLVITDKSGKDRALVFVGTDDASHVTLLGNNGGNRVDLVARASNLGASVLVSSGLEHGDLSATIGAHSQLKLTDGDYSSYLLATSGTSSLILGGSGEGGARNTMAAFHVAPNFGGALELFDPRGRIRVELVAEPNTGNGGVNPQLLLLDRDGKKSRAAP